MYFNKNGFPPSHVLDGNEVVFGSMTPDSTTTNSDKESFYFWRLQRLKKNVCRTSSLATFGDQQT
jgi:hypothetical protein